MTIMLTGPSAALSRSLPFIPAQTRLTSVNDLQLKSLEFHFLASLTFIFEELICQLKKTSSGSFLPKFTPDEAAMAAWHEALHDCI